MAYTNGNDSKRRWTGDDEDDEFNAAFGAATDNEDDTPLPPPPRNRTVSTVRGEDVREGEYRVLLEDDGSSRARVSSSRPRSSTSRSYDYADATPTRGGLDDDDGYDVNSAYAGVPTRGGNAPLVRIPRSIPWVSVGCFGVMIAVAVMLVVLALSLSGTVGGIGGFVGGLFGGGNKTNTLGPDQPAVVQQMRGLNRIESAQYTIEKIITAYENTDYLNGLFGSKVIFVAHADVVAGVDMSKLGDSDITVSQSPTGTLQATVKLPPAEIFNTTLDEKKSYVYSLDKNSFLASPNPAIFDYVRATAQDEIRKAAEEQGIITLATKNARDNVELLLRRLGYTSITFKLPVIPLCFSPFQLAAERGLLLGWQNRGKNWHKSTQKHTFSAYGGAMISLCPSSSRQVAMLPNMIRECVGRRSWRTGLNPLFNR